MTPPEWAALSWDLQETYLQGLAEDPNVPFSFSEGNPFGEPGQEGPQGMPQPVIRQVETDAKVFDIRGMIAELESDPAARKRS
jgi:hypothetical protein